MTIKTKFKRTVIAASMVFAISGTYSAPSHAVASVVIDPGAIAEAINGNIQSIKQWAQEKAMSLAKMDFDALLAELNIDNMNNAIANVITRGGLATQDVQNLEVLKESAPDKDACSTLTLQILSDDISCQAADNVKTRISAMTSRNSNFSGNEADYKQNLEASNKNVVDVCKSLTSGDDNDSEDPLKNTLCTRADLLIGSSTGDTKTPEETEATQKIIEILTGVSGTFKGSSLLEENSPTKNAKLIQEIKMEAYRSAVSTSLLEVSAMRDSPTTNGSDPLPSPLALLSKFVEERFGSSEWVSTIGNINADTKNTVYGPEINRKIATMEAFQLNMEMIKLKQQIRMEGLMALMLMYQIEPPEL